jgi:hypothetical protein
MTTALDTDSITELFESLTSPCHFSDLTVVNGQITSRNPCNDPAKWIIRYVTECGHRVDVACCDRHHGLLLAPSYMPHCPTHWVPESIHDVVSDSL